MDNKYVDMSLTLTVVKDMIGAFISEYEGITAKVESINTLFANMEDINNPNSSELAEVKVLLAELKAFKVNMGKTYLKITQIENKVSKFKSDNSSELDKYKEILDELDFNINNSKATMQTIFADMDEIIKIADKVDTLGTEKFDEAINKLKELKAKTQPQFDSFLDVMSKNVFNQRNMEIFAQQTKALTQMSMPYIKIAIDTLFKPKKP